ncbi:thiamine diphosphate-binding protein [Fusarium solani]|uniref:Thiamine diphosphate-binding protein n=1 Tax=Fusarium solani TaxID=169388 RepID=A0A9P9GTD7_FUSSL|nr:thiamine diphosphate-binding protein [Fusarium solani]KAH7244951.1 thiamine diphosphate-binding protein [Fusarium solani]
MNHTMHHSSGGFCRDPRQLDRVSQLLTGFVSKSEGDCESARLKASIGIALFKYVMRYGLGNSRYFNRDRLVTSGRYNSKWQDLFGHLIAAKNLTVDPIRLASVLSRTSASPCHSTQAISNAIGQAIAMKNLAMLYNKPGLELLDNMIWCVIDDARFQQGGVLETIALAGCWRLSNLCVIYDGIYGTPGPSVDVSKLKKCGWNVIELVNDNDLTVTALGAARRSNVPAFVNIQPPDSSTSDRLPFPPNVNTPLHLLLELYDFFEDVSKRSNIYEADWLVKVKAYQELYPALAKEFWDNVAGKNLVKPTGHQHYPTTTAGPITPPLSPLPRSRRGKHSSLRRDKPSQRPGRHSTPSGTKSETLHIRPCDAEEAAGAFLVSIRSTELPTTISLPQNGTINFPGHSSRQGVTLGAYEFSNCHGEDFHMTLISAGVGVHYAMGTQDFLLKKYCLKARIVSCPCLKLLQLQTEEYKISVLQPQSGKPTVAIDFGNSQGWEPYADALVSLEEGDDEEIGGNQPDRIGPRVRDFVKEFKERRAE